jgi:hypothetical protein
MIEHLSWIICLVLVIGGTWLWYVVPRKEKFKRFADRAELKPDEIYARFFSEKNLPKGLVLELWNEVANCLRLSSGKLRPSDRFDKELAPVKGWEFDDDIVEVNWAAERRLKALGSKPDPSEVQTLGDYVEFFCRLESKRHSA